VIFTALAALKLSPTFLDENSLKVWLFHNWLCFIESVSSSTDLRQRPRHREETAARLNFEDSSDVK
jgi:hypothetical protein